jgi:hypothetical protein
MTHRSTGTIAASTRSGRVKLFRVVLLITTAAATPSSPCSSPLSSGNRHGGMVPARSLFALGRQI